MSPRHGVPIGLALLVACGGGSEPSDLPGPPVALEIVSGNDQIVAPGDTTDAPLIVRVLDQARRPVPAVAVTFHVSAGRGNLVDGTEQRRLEIQTDDDGMARAFFAVPEGLVPDSTYLEVTTAELSPVEFLVRIGFPEPPPGAEMASAADFTCRVSHAIHCWGTLQDDLPPTSYSGAQPVAVDGYGETFCVAVPHGRYCWGDNSSGQYGNGLADSYGAPHLIQDGLQFVSLAVGGTLACGLDRDAVMWCWSKVTDLIITSNAGVTGYPGVVAAGIQRIDAGESFVCGVSARNTIHCTGQNHYGQLGNSNPSAREGLLEGPRFIEVTAGANHACALDDSGYAWCWGRNDTGQLGDGTQASAHVPARVLGDHQFRSIAAGQHHTCGLTADGKAWCWGLNSFGPLGDSTRSARSAPVPVAGDFRFSALAAGKDHTCAIMLDGRTACWGAVARGQVGNPYRFPTPVRFPIDRFTELGPMASERCARVTVETYCWGNGEPGIELVTEAHGLHGLVSGFGFRCALDGAGAAFCWGSNQAGQLGTGAVGGTQANPVPVAGGHAFTRLIAGSSHACGLTTLRRIVCWGSNYQGALGTASDLEFDAYPQEVHGGQNYIDISSAGATGHTCAVAESGTAYCWGSNAYGALGVGDDYWRLIPTQVGTSARFASVHVFRWTSCALTQAGEAYCWGANHEGGLGYTTPVSPCAEGCSLLPKPVQTDVRFVSLAPSETASCGVAVSGLVWCWGGGPDGERGNGFTDAGIVPTRIQSDLTFVEVAMGFGAPCGRTTDGQILCWGSNAAFQLGHDFRAAIPFPRVLPP